MVRGHGSPWLGARNVATSRFSWFRRDDKRHEPMPMKGTEGAKKQERAVAT